MKQQALTYLQTALNNPQAAFHDGQWESIVLFIAAGFRQSERQVKSQMRHKPAIYYIG